MTKTNKKTVNIALQGGGARGAFTWGVLDKFLEDGRIVIEGISATSAGSLNAAVLTQGLINGGNEGARSLLNDFWHQLGEYGNLLNLARVLPSDYVTLPYLKTPAIFYLFRVMISLYSPYQFNQYNFNPIREVLGKLIDIEKLKKQDKIDLYFCATNVKTSKLHVFPKSELSFNAILASCALPHLFQAVEVNGEFYWDGGFLGNPAIFPLIYNTKSKDVIIIHTSPFKRSDVPNDSAETIHRMTEIAFNSCLVREIRAIAFVTKILQEGWIKDEFKDKLKPIYMHCVDADHVLQEMSLISTYNTDLSFFIKLRDLGRAAAEAWLDQNYDSLGKNSTLDFDEWL